MALVLDWFVIFEKKQTLLRNLFEFELVDFECELIGGVYRRKHRIAATK